MIPTHDDQSVTRTRTRALKRAGLVLVLWTVFGLLWSASSFIGGEHGPGAPGFIDASDHVVPFYWAWAILTLPVLALARRTTAARAPTEWRRWTGLAAAAPVAIVAHWLVYTVLLTMLRIEPRYLLTPGGLASYTWRHGGGNIATYLTIVGVYVLFEAARHARERDITAASLETRLARADLALLRWQLQPHFLFNALNTVSTLVLKNEANDANRAIALISRYLRGTLADRPDAILTLAAELDAVRNYVDIETLRFGPELCVTFRVADEVLSERIPGSLLQPLVENAIRHGGKRDGGRAVVLAARREGDRVIITVSDPGSPDVAVTSAADSASGFGLRYVRERLRLFYGEHASFDLSASRDGTIATLNIPRGATDDD